VTCSEKNMHEVIHHSRADGSALPCGGMLHLSGFPDQGSLMHVDDEVVWRADGACLPVEYWSHPVKHGGEDGGRHGDVRGYHGEKSGPGGAAPGA
jgi:hypothetical protein